MGGDGGSHIKSTLLPILLLPVAHCCPSLVCPECRGTHVMACVHRAVTMFKKRLAAYQLYCTYQAVVVSDDVFCT